MTVLVPLILSLSVHEFAHAWSAYKLGDDTASLEGRMTLNPAAHIDPIGTLIIPIISAIPGGIALIGWAKPVPVTPVRFRRGISMRSGMIITALAGPASNIIIAFIAGLALVALYSRHFPVDMQMAAAFSNSHWIKANSNQLELMGIGRTSAVIAMFLGKFVILNVALAVFNMVPIPPLDGSRLLPDHIQEKMASFSMLIFLGFIVLINMGHSILWAPIQFAGNLILGFWGLIF